jgi:hypothetical protein
LITNENRRHAQLALLLRAQTLVDVDCWSVVYGHPLQPGMIHQVLLQRLDVLKAGLNAAHDEGAGLNQGENADVRTQG